MQAVRPKVTRFERTCWGMPSQWEGEFDDGREWYGRYRGSSGYICAAPKEDFDLLSAPVLVSYKRNDDGNPLDGLMSDRQFVTLLSLVAEVPEGIVPPCVIPGGEDAQEWDTENIADRPLIARTYP